jgi:hypothetical protein
VSLALPKILPHQCFTYTSNFDSSRNILNNLTGSLCDSSLLSGGKWVRFEGMAGTRLASSANTTNLCGTTYPGYYSGTHPTTLGDTNDGYVCYFYSNSYYYSNGPCYWQSSIKVTNCGDFFVYYLPAPPTCNLRYCTA